MDITLQPLSKDLLKQMTRSELLALVEAEQSVRQILQDKIEELESANTELKAGVARIGGILVKFQNRLFGKSSEKSPSRKDRGSGDKRPRKKRRKTSKLPSERYPDATIIERDIELQTAPQCSSCTGQMTDSGMTEVSEYIQVIPKEYVIIRQHRHKYRCTSCHGDVKTAPGLPRIRPGSVYSDEMMIDITLSKYCDLIPVERYRQIAERQGFPGLPANSLIEATHHLADFITPAVERVRQELLKEPVLQADETPHRMLEGSETSSWYLWGFSSRKASYFECHDTRSGDVAFELLVDSRCEVLVSDVFSGYGKAVRTTNQKRVSEGQPEIANAYCNAHARRKFKECAHDFPELSDFFIGIYADIYKMEAESKGLSGAQVMEARQKMAPLFTAMKEKAVNKKQEYSKKSGIYTALNYFSENFEGLTHFLRNADVPIDNNAQERALRSPVVGRKTWYGTHSERGAVTAAKHFTLVESCKLVQVNPRVYYKALVKALHEGQPAFTPSEFKEREKT